MNKYCIIRTNNIDWDLIPKAEIANSPWKKDYPAEYKAHAQVANLGLCLAVRLTAYEKEPLRSCREDNGPVYKDSCLEFFIMPDRKTGVYYNFECNPNGAMLVGVGNERNGRSFVKVPGPYREAFNIITEVNEDSWSVQYMIPFGIIGGTCETRGNFYKCREDDDRAHFMCWNNIVADKPDFHRPEFFGALEMGEIR